LLLYPTKEIDLKAKDILKTSPVMGFALLLPAAGVHLGRRAFRVKMPNDN
jgi:hypothetical protein